MIRPWLEYSAAGAVKTTLTPVSLPRECSGQRKNGSSFLLLLVRTQPPDHSVQTTCYFTCSMPLSSLFLLPRTLLPSFLPFSLPPFPTLPSFLNNICTSVICLYVCHFQKFHEDPSGVLFMAITSASYMSRLGGNVH